MGATAVRPARRRAPATSAPHRRPRRIPTSGKTYELRDRTLPHPLDESLELAWAWWTPQKAREGAGRCSWVSGSDGDSRMNSRRRPPGSACSTTAASGRWPRSWTCFFSRQTLKNEQANGLYVLVRLYYLICTYLYGLHVSPIVCGKSLHVSPIVEAEKVYMFLRWKTLKITAFCGKQRPPR